MRSSWGLSLVLGRLIAPGASPGAASGAVVVLVGAAPLLRAGSAERLAVTADG